MLNIIKHLPTAPTNKPSLLFVHGAWHGAWCWQEHYLPYFAAQGYTAYALDLRGHGQSPNSKSLRFTTLGDYVNDVAKAAAQIEGDVIIIGHSLGGMVVQKYLKTNSKAAGGILLATVPWYGALKNSLYFIKNMPLKFLKMLFTLSTYPIVENAKQAGEIFLNHDNKPQDVARYMARLQDEAYLAFMQMTLPSFGKIPVPMLVIGAEKDDLFAPETQQATANKYNAECHIIKDAPHDIMLDKRWQTSASIINNWLNQNF